MKHAVIILAYNNFDHLKKLISYFTIDCDVYLHIDKDSTLCGPNLIELRSAFPDAHIYSKFNIHWGGYSILRCEIFMLREALSHSEARYFHLLSGQDYPVRPLSFFLQFFEHNDKDYLSLSQLPNENWDKNTFSRFQYFYFHDYLRVSRNSRFLAKLVALQKKIGLCRSIPNHFKRLYGGSQWMSLTRESVSIMLDFTRKHPSFYRRMRFVFAPDEIYIQTVLKNLLEVDKIVPSNMRFIRYFKENGSRPANLDCNHMHLFLEQNVLFARKFSCGISDELRNVIDSRILSDPPLRITNTGAWEYEGLHRYKFNYLFFDFLRKYIVSSGLKDGVDVGCGIGLYVLNLRLMGFPIIGYDGNKEIETITRLLFPKRDSCCECLDLTEKWDDSITYDLTLCLDVLTYIPPKLRIQAICNLIKITGKSLIISIPNIDETQIIIKEIQSKTDNRLFLNSSLSNMCMSDSKDNMIYLIFERKQ